MSLIGEFERDVPLTEEEIHYDPSKEKRAYVPFPPALIDTSLENGQPHFHGVCGRNEEGMPTLPEGYRWVPDDGGPNVTDESTGQTDRLCHRREMTVAEVADFKQRGLIPADIERWYMFFNPTREDLADAAIWP
jgi:hypothetical protein